MTNLEFALEARNALDIFINEGLTLHDQWVSEGARKIAVKYWDKAKRTHKHDASIDQSDQQAFRCIAYQMLDADIEAGKF